MSETIITVTEAARNFADCVNRAHYQNMSFLLVKNGIPFARLVPAGLPVCRGKELAEALADVDLPQEEAIAWKNDLEAARRALKAPSDLWQ